MSRSPRPLFFMALLLACLYAATSAAASYYDPPGRVARLSHSQGEVSISPAGEDSWYGIDRNRPVVRGDRLWTDRGALAEFQVGSAAIRLAQQTSVGFLELNDNLVQLDLSEGSINLRVRRLYAGQEIEIATPGLAFVIDRPGNYRIDVDPRNDSTTVVAWRGEGVAYGEGRRFAVRTGDAVRFYGIGLRDYELFGLPRADAFDRYCFDRDRRLDQSLSLRYVGDDMLGYSDLDSYGYWRTTPGYGNVWYPSRVNSDWAPYSDGRWIWQDPWGWTWVDNAPWGFAPSHYGRWGRFPNGWGWIPGPYNSRPYYAPALVVFIGGQGWGISLNLGGGLSIGWFPLGPHDVYLPPYQSSRNYFSQVNISNTVINNTTINNVYNNYSTGKIDVNRTNYVNRTVADAVTAVPTKVFVDSQPVRPARVRPDREALNRGPLTRVAPIAPNMRSVLGAERPTTARPTRNEVDRPVFVRRAPPASPRPFAERQQQLQSKPGVPLTTPPEPRSQDQQQRKVRVIKDAGSAVDLPRAEATSPAGPSKAPALDRSVNRRTSPARGSQQAPVQQMPDEPPVLTPPKQRPPQAPERSTGEARAQANAQAQAKADAEARAEQQAQAKADAEARAEQQAQARADAAARAEQQAQARADAAARAEQQEQAKERAQTAEQSRVEAQARAEAQAQARAERQAKAEAEASLRAEPPPKPRTQDKTRPANRRPPNCLTADEVETLKQRAGKGQELPPFVACEAEDN